LLAYAGMFPSCPMTPGVVGKHMTVKASGFNKSQQRSTSGSQLNK
jgi:hypothetical protein